MKQKILNKPNCIIAARGNSKRLKNKNILTYGLNKKADYRVNNIFYKRNYSSFDLHYKNFDFHLYFYSPLRLY